MAALLRNDLLRTIAAGLFNEQRDNNSFVKPGFTSNPNRFIFLSVGISVRDGLSMFGSDEVLLN